MSYMKGDLLSRTRKLVKGMAIAEPRWLKAMERAPPPHFPHGDGKVKQIVLPEDKYIRAFHLKHPNAKFFEDSDKFNHTNPPPSQVFGWRVLELKKQGVSEEDAMAVVDMEYQAEMRAKKKAYTQLKEVNKRQGKFPPPNPFPKLARYMVAEEKKYVRARYANPRIRDILQELVSKDTPLW